VESLNRVLRKTLKTKGSFPTEEATTKLIFLAIRKFEKGGRAVREWGAARNQLTIMFAGRFDAWPYPETAWARSDTQSFRHSLTHSMFGAGTRNCRFTLSGGQGCFLPGFGSGVLVNALQLQAPAAKPPESRSASPETKGGKELTLARRCSRGGGRSQHQRRPPAAPGYAAFNRRPAVIFRPSRMLRAPATSSTV
jgi:hypothetical protein